MVGLRDELPDVGVRDWGRGPGARLEDADERRTGERLALDGRAGMDSRGPPLRENVDGLRGDRDGLRLDIDGLRERLGLRDEGPRDERAGARLDVLERLRLALRLRGDFDVASSDSSPRRSASSSSSAAGAAVASARPQRARATIIDMEPP